MLKSKEIEKQYKFIYDGLEVVKAVEDPTMKAKLFLGFNAAKIIIEDNMECMEKMDKMIEGFINMYKTGKVLKEV